MLDTFMCKPLQKRGIKLKLVLYRIGIKLHVARSSLYFEIAKLYTELGQLDSAIAAYRHHLQHNPKNAYTYHVIGDLLTQQQKWSEAEVAYRKAIELNPDFFWSHQKLADVLHQQQKWSEAEVVYRKAIELNPKFFWSHQKLADILHQQQKWSEAEVVYRKAIELNSEFFWSHQKLADVLRQQKNWSEAEAAYRKAIALDSDRFQSYVGLGEALSQQEKLDEIVPVYKTANRLRVKRHFPQLSSEIDRNCWQPRPNFIAIGCQKGGTTSLFYYLEQHPQVLLSVKKEIHFWSIEYERGLEWYLSHFPPLPPDSSIITGEASTTYLNFPESAERLVKFFPDTPIIVLFRNPVDRAISHYHHWVKIGLESRSLEEAIEEQMSDFKIQAGGWNSSNSYVARGVYVKLIEPWLERFQDKILILSSESFYRDTDRELDRVRQFLNLPPFTFKTQKIYNSGSYSLENMKIRERLERFYEPYNRELETLLNFSFNWDRST
ncbi:MAG: tetratricopeptide repeat protein [Cyanobacteria bacterium SID2]|nr:tetratricopeptide repeat protein [Cyanobacteria bacterium SID2]